jgi:NitT/TauT family transport system ATP-binding protein
VLNDVSFDIPPGNVVALMGPSGCGKSTLLSIIGGWIFPDSGRVLVDDVEVRDPGPDRPVCFQSDTAFAWLSVIDNLRYGPRVQRRAVLPELEFLLDRVGLTGFGDTWPRDLSGGMRKRLELARVMAAAAPDAVLLLDEAFGSVDPKARLELHGLLRALLSDFGHSALITTHDPFEACFVADAVIVLTPRPATIAQYIVIPFGPQRDIALVTSRPFQMLHAQLLDMLLSAVSRETT